MKKFFLMIAVVGLMASCTGNGKTSGSTSGEQKDSAKTEAAKDQKKVGPFTFDNASWTINVPEGWQVEGDNVGKDQKSPSYLCIEPLQKPEGVTGLTFVKISSYPYKVNTVEDSQKTFKNSFKLESVKIESETIGGVKFAKISVPASDKGSEMHHLCAALTPEGNITIEVHGYKLDDPVIKSMLESFKLKPAEPAAK